MANWHARSGHYDGNSFQILFHIPIPNVVNRVNVNYRTAVVRSGVGGTTVMTEGVGDGLITTAEKAQIVAGELYEHSEMVSTNPGETAAQLQARIDAMFTALTASVQAQLSNRLAYWGFARNVP